MQHVRSVYNISDSIAICILDKNAIITGVGNELHFHGTKSDKLNINLKGKIHGITKGNGTNANKLLVFGEKEFTLLAWNQKYEFQLLYRGWLTDWISAATFLDDSAEFVLLTAHSVLLCFNYAQNKDLSTICTFNKRSSCEDKSTLYCAYLFGRSWNNLVVFGGNAFGELIIWQPEILSTAGAEIDENKAKILQNIAVHNGVIFSIDYEPVNRLVITTSDDRSVRIWHVGDKKDWAEVSFKPVASGYGHTARVFQGMFLQYGDTTYIATVGEDSYLCIWHTTGELLFKKRQHFGATIWNLAYDNNIGTLYTVGSTGNLLSSDLNQILESRTRSHAIKLTPVNHFDTTEYVAKVRFVSDFSLVGVTNCNRFVLYNIKTEAWEYIEAFSEYKCTVLEVYKNLIAICGYKHMTLFECDEEKVHQLYDAEVLSGVIRSFHFVSEARFILSDDQGNCVLLNRDDLSKQYFIELPKCKERWLTAAIMVTDKMLLVSNRAGNVMMYRYNIQQNNYELQSTLKHPHGHLGVTNFKTIVLDELYAYIQSAGHDSTIKVLRLDFEANTLSISHRRNVPIAWIEHVVRVNMTDLHLGFNDNHFVVWSEEQDIILQIECGGGHRCWDYHIYENSAQALFIKLVFIKNKNVLQYDFPLFQKSTAAITLPYRNRWHVRPCNVVEIIDNEKSNSVVTISAGDDNLIKVSVLRTHNNLPTRFEQKTEIHHHISNVRALKACKSSSSEECLIFSGGGRAQLCVAKLNLENFIVTELLNYTLKPSTRPEPKSRTHSFDPETRIMSIDVLNKHNCGYFVYAACSDGYLRKFSLNENFEINLEREYFHGKCVLQVRLVNTLYLISATTEGMVFIHDLDLNSIYLKAPLHASGINGLDIIYCPQLDTLHLVTGGDDQAVVYAKISTKKHEEPLLIEKLDLPQLHTAQVTALRFSDAASCIYSSGVDQNLVKYDLRKQEIVQMSHSCVADVKGIALSERENVVLIYGCGLQVYSKIS